MPAGGNDLKATVRLEGGAAFKKEISDINSSMKQLDAESKNISATFDGQANSLEALTAKQKNLVATLEQAERKVQAYGDRIQSLKTQQANIAESTEKYRTELKSAQAALSKMEKGTEAYEKQAKAVDDLSRKVALGEQNQERATKEIEKYATEQTKAETEVAKLNHEIDRNSQYLQEAENSADKCATSIDEYGRRNKEAAEETRGLGDIAKVALGNLAAEAATRLADAAADAVRALAEAGRAAAAYADEILEAASVTGLSTDTLQEYSYAADLIDTSLEDVERALAKNVKSMSSAQAGSKSYAEAYEKLGVSVTDASGELRSSEDVFWDCIDALGKVENETEADAIAMQLFGKSARDLNPLIEAGSDGFRKFADEAHEAGAVLDGETLESLGEVDDSFQRLEQQTSAFQNAIGASIAPLLGTLAEGATNFLNSFTKALTPPPKSDLENYLENLRSDIEQTQERIANLGNIEISANADIAGIEAYRDVLEKATTGEQLSEVEKYKLQAAVESLSGVIPGLAEAYDAESGSIDMTTDALKRLLEQTEKQIKLNAYKSVFEEAYKAQAEAANDATRAQDGYDAAVNQLRSSFEGLSDEEYENLGIMDAKYAKLVAIAMQYDLDAGALEKYRQAITDAKTDLDDATASQEEADKAAEQAKRSYESLIGMTMSAEDVFRDYAAALQESVEADKQGADGAKIRADAADELDRALQAGIITQEQYKEALSYNNFKNAAQGAIKYGEAVAGVVVTEKAMAKARELRLQATQAEEHGDKESAAALREQAAMFEAGILAVDENTGEIKDNTGAVVENTDAVKEETAAVEESGLAWMQRKSVVASALESTIEMSQDASARAEASAEAEKNALETTRQAYEDNYNSIKNTLSQKLSLWDAFDGGEDVTVEQMIENLKSQNEGITQYKQEMEEVIAAYGDELGPDLISTLQSMGSDAANTWHHMWVTMSQDNAPELFTQMGQEWTKGLNLADQIASYCAGNLTAYQLATGQMGSTKIEWTGLRESVQNMTPELDAAITAAQAAGVAIPEGLTEGLASGEVSTTTAAAQITSALEGTFNGLYEIAQQSGADIPTGLEEGIDGSAEGYQAAINKLTESLSEAGNEAGSAAADEISSGLEDNISTVETSASNTAGAAKKGMDSKKSEFSTSGQTSAQQYSQGITSQRGQATSAGRQLAQAAKSGASGKDSEVRSVGYNMAPALAAGIRAGQISAINAAVNMAVEAYRQAKNAIGQRSPTGIFKDELGKNVPLAFAAGIKQYQASAERAASEMAMSTFDAAQMMAAADRMDPRAVQASPVTVDTSPIARMIGGMSSGAQVTVYMNIDGSGDPEMTGAAVSRELKQLLRMG